MNNKKTLLAATLLLPIVEWCFAPLLVFANTLPVASAQDLIKKPLKAQQNELEAYPERIYPLSSI